jgi:hypothetical protein
MQYSIFCVMVQKQIYTKFIAKMLKEPPPDLEFITYYCNNCILNYFLLENILIYFFIF